MLKKPSTNISQRITFRDLLKDTNPDTIFRYLYKFYPETFSPKDISTLPRSSAGFLLLYKELIGLGPTEDPELIGYEISIDGSIDTEGIPYAKVTLKNPIKDTVLALDLISWSRIIDLPINKSTLFIEIPGLLAHIIWEITFYGFTASAIEKSTDEILGSLPVKYFTKDEIKNMDAPYPPDN